MQQRLDYLKTAPEGVKGFAAVGTYLGRCSVPVALVDLVYLRVSQINGCAFCIDKHSRDLIRLGMPVDKLVLVPAWREAGALFDERERAALAWSEIVTRVAHNELTEADYIAVAKVFNETELVDLTLAISLMNARNRMGISFGMTPLAVSRLLAKTDA